MICIDMNIYIYIYMLFFSIHAQTPGNITYVIRIVHKLLIGIDIFALHNEKTSWNIDHDVNMYTDGPLK